MLGWFLSCVTESSTAFFTAFLIGANMSYWLMQHALVIHLPINKIRTTIIKNQETSWNQWGSLTLIALQYFGLISCYCFDTGLPLHYCLGGLMGISLLKINDDLKRIL